MDYIKYKTTLKASGDEYKKIVFWNRFVRNPVQFSAEALWLTGIFKKSHYRIPPPQIPVFLIRQIGIAQSFFSVRRIYNP